jgi:hypothetical protein
MKAALQDYEIFSMWVQNVVHIIITWVLLTKKIISTRVYDATAFS